MKPADWLILQKKVRFGDCDSAGVIHFHNLLIWSHEAWEESIEIYLNLLKKFSQSWPKNEKPEKWIVKNKNSITEKINYKFKK